MKIRPITHYRNFWLGIEELSLISDETARPALIKFMSSANELFTAFVSKVLPFLAPLPAAFNMGRILVETHGRMPWEGVVLALVIELIGYGVTERTVVWWFDEEQHPLKQYIAVSLSVLYFSLLFGIVYALEGWGVAMIFPALSLIAATFYALVRQDEIVSIGYKRKFQGLQKDIEELQLQLTETRKVSTERRKQLEEFRRFLLPS